MGEDWTQTRLQRASVVRIYDVADRLVLLDPGGGGQQLHGDSAALARSVLLFLDMPHTGAEVLAHIEDLTGGPVEHVQVVEDLLRLLLQAGAVERVSSSAAQPDATMRRRGGPSRVVLGLTGAVATMHAPMLVQQLLARGFEVRVAATDDALRFVRVEALEALTHHPVVSGMWDPDGGLVVPHIELARWADAVVVCPASATTISRLATADYASVVAAIALATRAPVLVVPSMNAAMYASPGVQRNLALLSEDGVYLAHPGRGPELADRPDRRVPTLGASPPHAVVLRLLDAVLAEADQTGRKRSPRDAEDWNAVYGSGAPADLPWHSPTVDDDLARVLDDLGSQTRNVLDIGTGLGTLAAECARRGHRVVATDISDIALDRARQLCPDASVVWVQDDITASRLRGAFDLVLDRGCLHLLDTDGRRSYATAMQRLTAPGATLVVKTLTAAEAAKRELSPCGQPEIQALLGTAFQIVRRADSSLPGPAEAPDAQLFVLRREAHEPRNGASLGA